MNNMMDIDWDTISVFARDISDLKENKTIDNRLIKVLEDYIIKDINAMLKNK
jgi:hypothetical protein